MSDSDSEDDLSQFGRSKIVMTHSYFLTDSLCLSSVQWSGRSGWAGGRTRGRGPARLAGSVLADHVSHVCPLPPLQTETQCSACGAVVTVSIVRVRVMVL